MIRGFLALLLATLVPGPSGWSPIPAESKIIFSGTQVAGRFEGTLPTFSGTGCFDLSNPESANGTLTFDLRRATTGNAERDAIMQAAEWLNTEAFPQSQYVIEKVQPSESGTFKAEGVLSLKGKKQALTIPFAAKPEGDFLKISGHVSFDRRDFGVGVGPWGETEKWVGFLINVDFHIKAAKGHKECEK